MADVALWNGATGAGNGTSWADAYTTLQAVITATGANPVRVFVASDHAELVTAQITFQANVQNYQFQIISVDRTSGWPPTAEQAGARIGSTDSIDLTLNNSFYSKGVFWHAGNGGTGTRNLTLSHTTNGLAHIFRAVGGGFELKNSGAASRFIVGGAGLAGRNSEALFDGVELKFGNVGQGLQIRNAHVRMRGGTTAGSAITEFIKSLSDVGTDTDIAGLDMSTCATSMNLLAANIVGTGAITFDKIKAPASWTGSLIATLPVNTAIRAMATNVDYEDTNYNMVFTAGSYQVRSDTAVYRSGGATDGTTPISWRFTTNSNVIYPVHVVDAPPIVRWNETVGSPVTVTVETLTDGVTLTNDDAWVEVTYFGASGNPLGSVVSDEHQNQLVAPDNQDASSASWTAPGITSPVTQTLSVTFTPQEKGFISAAVFVGRGGSTIYVCPQIEVS